MRNSQLRQPIHFDDLAVNLDRTKRPDASLKTYQRDAPAGHFYWDEDVFHLAGRSAITCSSLRALDPEVFQSLKENLVVFASSGQYANVSFLKAVQSLRQSFEKCPGLSFDKAWVFQALTVAGFRTSHSTIRSFFLYWSARYPGAITADALHHLVKTTVTRGISGNVLSDDPEKSWLTDIEYDATLQAVWRNYDALAFGTQITFMRLLSMQYARRPIQISNLKIGDFRDGAGNGEGIGRSVQFPGAKDKLAEIGFRDSKIETHPVAAHLWDLFLIQRHDIRSLFETTLEIDLNEDEFRSLPLFTTVARIEKAVTTIEHHFKRNWRETLGDELFHLGPITCSKILTWRSNGHDPVPALAPPISHRTGRPIIVSATRMRHTRARQLARLGMPRHVLSYWMGHASEKSIEAYYNDPAEEARQINDAMGTALMPMALAFTGKLIDDESQASRATDPESRLEFADGSQLTSVGNCGKHSFCATTSVPVPCYRCKHFEPLVFAPHTEVLQALLTRQAEENETIKNGGRRRLLIPIDLSSDIRAVRAAIERCDARRAELEKAGG
jgi:integrase